MKKYRDISSIDPEYRPIPTLILIQIEQHTEYLGELNGALKRVLCNLYKAKQSSPRQPALLAYLVYVKHSLDRYVHVPVRT